MTEIKFGTAEGESLLYVDCEDGCLSMGFAPVGSLIEPLYSSVSKDLIRGLIPYLQGYLATGELEHIERVALQGDKQDLDTIRVKLVAGCSLSIDERHVILEELADVQADKTIRLALTHAVVDQGGKIEALQRLVRDWREFNQYGMNEPQELIERTAKLLGEEG